MSEFTDFLTMLSTEFRKYLVEHDSIAARVPLNALLVFKVDGEDRFNQWHREMSLRNREGDQPVVQVHVTQLRSHSLIERADVALAGA